jgi:hypothetical protein
LRLSADLVDDDVRNALKSAAESNVSAVRSPAADSRRRRLYGSAKTHCR